MSQMLGCDGGTEADICLVPYGTLSIELNRYSGFLPNKSLDSLFHVERLGHRAPGSD